jgi:hypothetical protein
MRGTRGREGIVTVCTVYRFGLVGLGCWRICRRGGLETTQLVRASEDFSLLHVHYSP